MNMLLNMDSAREKFSQILSSELFSKHTHTSSSNTPSSHEYSCSGYMVKRHSAHKTDAGQELILDLSGAGGLAPKAVPYHKAGAHMGK